MINITPDEMCAMRLFRMLAKGRGYLGAEQISRHSDANGTSYHNIIKRLKKKGVLRSKGNQLYFVENKK